MSIPFVYATDLNAAYVTDHERAFPVKICLSFGTLTADQRLTPEVAEEFARSILEVAAQARADAEKAAKEAAIRAEIEARLAAEAQPAQREAA